MRQDCASRARLRTSEGGAGTGVALSQHHRTEKRRQDANRKARARRFDVPTPCAPRPCSDNQLRLRLPSAVTPAALSAVLAEIRSRARCGSTTRFILDCSAVSELSTPFLAEIEELRLELRNEGFDLVLVDCPGPAGRQLQGSGSAPLSPRQPVRQGAHPLQAPHSAFLRAFRSA
jgi:hypothetical protein